ncbi:MAG: hypothetical protein ACRES7_01310 [Gammaproteobacteria bacterium]
MILQSAVMLLLLAGSPALAASSGSSPAVPNGVNTYPYPLPEMTMAKVRQIFGQPEHADAPVPATAQGPHKPPITRWVYPDFIVYFERDLLLHTVVTHPRLAPRIYPPAAVTGG